jgi:hypothetical protein
VENAEHRVCKHALYVAREIAFLAWVAEQEAFLEARDEYRFDHVDDAQETPAPAWPSCPLHGPYDAAESGQPMSSCDRCEECRFP